MAKMGVCEGGAWMGDYNKHISILLYYRWWKL